MNGPLPIENVKFFCHISNVRDSRGSAIYADTDPEHPGAGLTTDKMKADEMKPGERATVPCPFPFQFPTPISTGDVAIEAKFRIGYTFIKTSRILRFVTQHAADGNIYWFPQPLSEIGNKSPTRN